MPCGLPEKSQFASIHAEHKALEQYIYNNKGRRNKKLTLIVWRKTSYGFGSAKPCDWCAMRTLPRYCKILDIAPIMLNIYYTESNNLIKTNLENLMNSEYVYHKEVSYD